LLRARDSHELDEHGAPLLLARHALLRLLVHLEDAPDLGLDPVLLLARAPELRAEAERVGAHGDERERREAEARDEEAMARGALEGPADGAVRAGSHGFAAEEPLEVGREGRGARVAARGLLL